MSTATLEKNAAGINNTEHRVVRPLTNISETNTELILLCRMPGVDEDSVDVKIEDGTLTISGTLSECIPHSGWTYAETEFANYRRVFKISDGIDESKIEATLKSGVLKLVLPKRVAPTYKIPIKTA